VEDGVSVGRSVIRAVSRLARGLALPLLFLGVWEFISRRSPAAAYAFVPLREVGRGLVETMRSGELPYNVVATLKQSFTGLLLGSLLGTSWWAERLLGPLYHGLRQVPLMGLVPLIGLWFGNGAGAKLLVVSLAAFYPVTLATAEGLRHVERAHLELARALVLDRRQTFRHVLLPTAVPFIVTGILQALAFTWIATVGSELLFSATSGLGGFMAQAQAGARMDLVIVAVASIAVVGLALNAFVTRVGRRVLRGREAT
jgi:sulfonate transport system permease protein